MARIRVTFSLFPLNADEQGAKDALNRAHYTLTGPGVVTVAFVNRVPGAPASFDLWLSGQLALGVWTLTVANIQTTFAETLTTAAVTFTAVSITVENSITEGAKDETAEEVMRRHLNPALNGKTWDALVAAIALADQRNWEDAQAAFDQLFLSSASGKFLERKAGDAGVQKPLGLGMSDELFRRLAILVTSDKLTQEVLLELLEIFYGEDALHAWASCALPAPFSLEDGDDLQLLIDEEFASTTVFRSGDFKTITQASAVETAAALTRAFQLSQVPAYALPWTDTDLKDYVKVYSASRGLGSSVRVTGGRAQRTLQFPQRIAAYNSLVGALPTWTITVLTAEGRARFTSTGPTGLDLSLVQIGDYVTIYGSEFAAGNRGTFPVVQVYQAYPAGVLTQYFEVENLTAGAQAGLAQVADSGLYYFRPRKQTAHRASGGVSVQQAAGKTKVSLPATSQAVTRGYLSAAYLNAPRALTVTSLTRSKGGTVTVGATAHGMTVGSQIEVLGAAGAPTLPSTIAGDLVGPPLKTSASLASLWSPLKASQARKDHSATLLRDGRVLLAGGYSGAAQLTHCEQFAVTATTTLGGGEVQYQYEWQAAGALAAARSRHRSILITAPIADGKVLLCGGWDGAASVATSYLFTPSPPAGAGAWAATGSLNTARHWHAISRLNNDKILACGGDNAGFLMSAELYDPVSGNWTNTGSMATPRSQHTATTLLNGSVMACGGLRAAGVPTHGAEVYDAAGGTWSATGGMSWARYGHAAVLLPDGRVLVVGGLGYLPSYGGTPAALVDCEVWSPTYNTWAAAGRLAAARISPVVIVTSDSVLVAGGGSAITERLDLRTMTWSRLSAPLDGDRDVAQGAALANGTILLSGGTEGGVVQTGSKLFVPAAERVFSGGLNGSFRVSAVLDENTLQFQTPENIDRTASGTATLAVSAVAAQSIDTLGPHIFDPNAGPAVTGKESSLTVALAGGQHHGFVDVADATIFPDQDGWLAFGFGTKAQTFPVRYHGRLSGTRLKLDFSFLFGVDLPIGTKVCLLKAKGYWLPSDVKAVGGFYVTGSNAGVAAASRMVDEVLAAGLPAEKTIVYPGDRGLGGEGLPAKAAKVSDKVTVWGSDDLDEDLAEARS